MEGLNNTSADASLVTSSDSTSSAGTGTDGTLVSFQRSGKKLAPKGAAIPVGKRAHGPVVVVGAGLSGSRKSVLVGAAWSCAWGLRVRTSGRQMTAPV